METVTQRFAHTATTMADDIDALLDLSRLTYCNRFSGGVVQVMAGDHVWQPLNEAGQRLQSKLKNEYRYYRALLLHLLKETGRASKFTELAHAVLNPILQTSASFDGELANIKIKARANLSAQVALLNGFYVSTCEEVRKA